MKQHSTILTTFAVVIAFLNTDLHGANADAHAHHMHDLGQLQMPFAIGKVFIAEESATRTIDVHLPLNEALVVAARIGDKKTVQAALKKKADVDHKVPEGFTALGIAAYNHHTPVVQLLLERRASLGAAFPNGVTPLHAALCEPGGNSTIKMLVSRGANMHYYSNDGITPWEMANQEQREIMLAVAQPKLFIKQPTNIEEAKEDTPHPHDQSQRRSPAEASRSANNAEEAKADTPLLAPQNQSRAKKSTLFSRIKGAVVRRSE